ncbi:universal stress protein [Natronobiforma cellulositropha]|uniref:universal stress protein n=1 Tax=Natronobiforma cellulositropha TaxID=1679076 RepID=UPI0021D5E8A6|nr:universal stress protein [Natronobiforma cellulositropha]
MHYLAPTDSVHTTAALCDYLDGRLTSDDTVTVVAVADDPDPDARRDCQDALNVAPVRLAGVDTLETAVLEGDPADAVLDAAAEREADELVICVRSGHPDATAEVGSTASAILARTPIPVVVAPLPDL